MPPPVGARAALLSQRLPSGEDLAEGALLCPDRLDDLRGWPNIGVLNDAVERAEIAVEPRQARFDV